MDKRKASRAETTERALTIACEVLESAGFGVYDKPATAKQMRSFFLRMARRELSRERQNREEREK